MTAPFSVTPLPAHPLVSIVMPAYNYVRFVREAIDSVLAQDHPRVELIVIDDGSTDGTRELLASYGDRFWWTSQANAGQTTAINRGTARASGDLIGYLNADDRLAPGAVTAAIAALRARPDAIMSYCDFALMDVESRQTLRRPVAPDIDLAAILRGGHGPFGPGSFVRREAAVAAGGWDPALSRVPDFDYALRLARLGPFVHVPHVMSWFRVHERSISFAAPPVAVTEEAILVVERFYATQTLPPAIVSLKGEALAMAHMTAAHGHFRARRWSRALACCARAARLDPQVMARPFVYRLVVSGMAGQFLHRVRHALRARDAHAGAAEF